MAFKKIQLLGCGQIKTHKTGDYDGKDGKKVKTVDVAFLYDRDGICFLNDFQISDRNYNPGTKGLAFAEIGPELVGTSVLFVAEVSEYGNRILRLERMPVKASGNV
ncbi:MAG: hypothetical protein HZA04_02540 [Nitrospinae bacterium]|nr:hypothetical protein [Nitrospinota bacterium]